MMQNVTWSIGEVIAHHGRMLHLWFKKDGKVMEKRVMVWVIYEQGKIFCTLYDNGVALTQAHRLDPEAMAAYLLKFSATRAYVDWNKEHVHA
jgi:hypothetical protein